MQKSKFMLFYGILLASLLLGACAGPVKKIDMLPYVPVQAPQVSFVGLSAPAPGACTAHPIDLIGAWVAAGSPDKDPFDFQDVNGKTCQGTFEADVQPFFIQPNLWYAGAPSCRTCHGQDVTVSYARMNLGDYQGILAGSGRDSVDVKGQDILGGGTWEKASLYNMLTTGQMPPDQPGGTDFEGLLVSAGKVK